MGPKGCCTSTLNLRLAIAARQRHGVGGIPSAVPDNLTLGNLWFEDYDRRGIISDHNDCAVGSNDPHLSSLTWCDCQAVRNILDGAAVRETRPNLSAKRRSRQNQLANFVSRTDAVVFWNDNGNR